MPPGTCSASPRPMPGTGHGRERLGRRGFRCNTRRAMRVLGALLLPVAVLLPAAYVGHRLSEDRPTPVRATAVVWAGGVFVDRASLDRWLHARGVRYAARVEPAVEGGAVHEDASCPDDRGRAHGSRPVQR